LGFMSGSPPPLRAATVSSLMRRVKILPRFASAAPFLCLMECHLECPDITREILPPFRQNDPHAGAGIPGPSVVIAQYGADRESESREAPRHRLDGQRAEGQIEAVLDSLCAALLDEALLEHGQPPPAVLAHRFDEREVGRAGAALQLHAVGVFAPAR